MKRNNPRNLKNVRRIGAASRLEARIKANKFESPEKKDAAIAELTTLQARIVS
jgi:hypothetical protein